MAGKEKAKRTDLHARVAESTPAKLKEIALKLDYTYNGEGSTGKLFDAIAEGKLILISTQNPAKSD